MLEHRRRPYAYDTYTGGVPCLSSSFSEIGDFDSKDESGNALLAPWLSLRFARIRPLGKGKGNTNERHDKRKSILFLKHARSDAYNVMDEPRMNYIYDDTHKWGIRGIFKVSF